MYIPESSSDDSLSELSFRLFAVSEGASRDSRGATGRFFLAGLSTLQKAHRKVVYSYSSFGSIPVKEAYLFKNKHSTKFYNKIMKVNL